MLRVSYFTSQVAAKDELAREILGYSFSVLSAAKPNFFLGFLNILEISSDFCNAHATRCMADRGVTLRFAFENRVVFRVAGVVKTLWFACSNLAPIHACGG